MPKKNKHPEAGFTLMEILIALFIFTILSVLLVGALHNVIGIEHRTEENAERLHSLQRALLIVSRDIEQAVNRPVLSASGREEPPFQGDKNQMMFTHAGFANPTGAARQSTLQRSGYAVKGNTFVRISYNVLDQAQKTRPHQSILLNNITDMYFEYLDKEGRFHPDWPLPGKKEEKLPRAVRIYLTIPNWGKMSQLYVISAQ